MRVLALDLGTKTLGLAISDETMMLSSPLTTLRYDSENYNYLLDELEKIINKYKVSVLVLGLPKNMDNSLGFASQRSLKFKELLEKKFDLKIELIDERLTTVEAQNILIENNFKRKKRKNVIDEYAAMLILDTYLRMCKNEQ